MRIFNSKCLFIMKFCGNMNSLLCFALTQKAVFMLELKKQIQIEGIPGGK